MEPVQITQEASQDIAKLAQGADRAQVALVALKESKLTPNQVQQLEALLKKVSPTKSAPSDSQSQAVSEIKLIGGHQAVVGQISVKGKQLDTLLSEGSFNKTRREQTSYAERLGGYRVATSAENRAYVEGLLAKEGNHTINGAEKNALNTYRERIVRDTEDGLVVVGRRVRVNDRCWNVIDIPDLGALFVRDSAELK